MVLENTHATPPRLILHVDVDAFFASVEQLLIPALRGRPVIVGNGVIASCSYEARKLGMKAGMALYQARRLCPGVVILDGDYQIYRCFAEHVWEVCRQYTCGLETYLDEAYGDATGMEGVHGPPPELGQKLQEQVRREVGLPVSVGLGPNRMLAKIGSHLAKPAGVRYIAAERAAEVLGPLLIEKIPGIGHKTARLLHDLSIVTVEQLRSLSRSMLSSMLGVRGEVIYDRARGEDDSVHERYSLADANEDPPNTPNPPSAHGTLFHDARDRVSNAHGTLSVGMPRTISRETTFHQPTCDLSEIRGMLFYLLERAMRMARSKRLAVGRVDVSIRYNDWRQQESGATLPSPTGVDEEVFSRVEAMLGQLYKRRVSLRHVGITLSRFSPLGESVMLFDPPDKTAKRDLCQTLDSIRDRFGHAAVVSGQSIALLGQLEQNDYGFVLRTPSLTK